MQTHGLKLAFVTVVAAMALGGGCADETDHTGLACSNDSDCGGSVPNLICDQSKVCADKATLRTIRVNWTINGNTPSGATCTGIDRMKLEFTSEDNAVAFAFDPVPCAAGSFPIDKMPNAVIKVKITATKLTGAPLVGESFIDGSGNVNINIK
ncbi:MAG: hypothetical protein KBG15_10960 [Kofleriaceae bacterium]|nr:hypothetical protein [Kofleriaceae bacterium]